MPIKNYTTKIDPHKTIWEIQSILSKHGAQEISISYDERSNPVAIKFMIVISWHPTPYKLPANYQWVKGALRKHHNLPASLRTDEHALRVSWRIIKDWIDSQLALIESEQAELSQIFLPYVLNKNWKTLYEVFKEQPTLLLWTK